MPPYTRGLKRDKLYFAKINALFLYGFFTGIDNVTGVTGADITALGLLDQTAADAIANRLMITRANSPVPPRFTKKFPNNPITARASVSTFGSFDAGVAAAAAGWRFSSPARGVSLNPLNGGTGRKATAIAELSSGALYAFPLDRTDFQAVQAVLGLMDASLITTDGERNRLVTGSKDKPARLSINDGGAKGTFCSTDSIGSAQAAGWKLLSGEIVEFPAAVGP